jgi:flagellar basal-body rod protein FlgC
MSNFFSIFNTSASALTAQSVRLNAVASNVANANVATGSPETAYKPKEVVFQTVLDQNDPTGTATPVRVAGVINPPRDAVATWQPNHPLANEEGYVFTPAISIVEEMANMMSASRSYEANVEVLETTKKLLQSTLKIGA